MAFIVAAAFLAVSALVSLLLVRTRRQDTTPRGGQEVLTELAEVI
ncbi:hypothetical protein M2163_000127 [Streptomyces sp. SAI-135]|jgi:hypothetical protein|nr:MULTISPECIES: hypothetical protein [unclassified Streptomyces]MDH6523368.1 hypothetical protein [Streptomyces sp. SAI-090]MDH6554992.1 hypothetical protein [Streptomyces sp. SAI-041]MDH6574259.1 hypothetical protein [Streptomyces sp. SAI-117]MDH6581009.1 hypothetical protein [Streptomyces sp. SAI-133]MDH6613019.1 hypothetical protein [Streptomyces sp. SAI-135]